MFKLAGRFFRTIKSAGVGGVLSWIHQSMSYVLIGLVATMTFTIYVLRAENQSMATSLASAVEAVDTAVTTLEGYEDSLSDINEAVSQVRNAQLELRNDTRSLYSFIDEVANEDDRTDDPFWDAYFDRLRNEAGTPED